MSATNTKTSKFEIKHILLVLFVIVALATVVTAYWAISGANQIPTTSIKGVWSDVNNDGKTDYIVNGKVLFNTGEGNEETFLP